MDFGTPVMFRGVDLNDAVASAGGIVGCQIDVFDPDEVEIRQFTEPQALRNGIDVGGVWLGARHIKVEGTVNDLTRPLTLARLDALATILLPVSSTFGVYDLTWTSGGTPKSISVMPRGIRAPLDRDKHGGLDARPLAIRWSVVFWAKDPAIT